MRSRGAAPSIGRGWSSCHHGELVQGIFRDDEGKARRGLVTVPLRELGTQASFTHAGSDSARIVTVPGNRFKAKRAAELTRDLCGHPRCGGRLELRGNVPVGLGMGSSTSDISAAIRAVASSFGVELPPSTVARVAVAAEGASDPLMLDQRPVLFAQREGEILEVLGKSLPAMVLISCTTGSGAPVDTLSLRRPPLTALDAFEELRVRLRWAISARDVGMIGAVSTESARLNQPFHAKEELDVLEDVAREAGAAGVQVAHSGNVAGLLFDATLPDVRHRLREGADALGHRGIAVTAVFPVGEFPAHAKRCSTTDTGPRLLRPTPEPRSGCLPPEVVRASPHRRVDRPPSTDRGLGGARVPPFRDHEGDLRDGSGV